MKEFGSSPAPQQAENGNEKAACPSPPLYLAMVKCGRAVIMPWATTHKQSQLPLRPDGGPVTARSAQCHQLASNKVPLPARSTVQYNLYHTLPPAKRREFGF